MITLTLKPNHKQVQTFDLEAYDNRVAKEISCLGPRGNGGHSVEAQPESGVMKVTCLLLDRGSISLHGFLSIC